jgi:bifunctional UDP-N-acetylglucosamine pyrophosphorylase/glucosamine-1-phosphate N-acetyltransferase
MPPLACIILAAGQGTRMQSDLPKVLHKVAGFPMIAHVRHACQTLNPQKIVTVIAPDMQAVADAVAPHPTVIQKEALGTAHAVLAAREALGDFKGRVIIVYGDTPLLRPETLRAMAMQKTPISVLAFEAQDPKQYGRVVLFSKELVGSIIEYADANEMQRQIRLCNGGVMAFEVPLMWDILGAIRPHNAKGEFYLTDLVTMARGRAMACGAVRGDEDEVMGVNNRIELATAEKLMQHRLRHEVMSQGVTLIDADTVYISADARIARDVTIGPHVVIGPSVDLEEGTTVLPFSHLEGCHVKKGARIGPYARLRPGTVIEENAHIGNFVEIKKTQVGAGAKINHLSYVGDARIGANTNIGAGTITCNYDGFNKHETSIGEGVFIGSNTALVAPVSIGDRAIVAASSTITQNVPEDALALSRQNQTTKEGWAKRYRDKKSVKSDISDISEKSLEIVKSEPIEEEEMQ